MKSRLIFTFILFPLTFALANIVHVPTIEAPTIQQGIDQAMKGDTILVAEGHYYENIFFRGKEITVASEFIMDKDTSHISKTIIDGSQHLNPDSGTVVYFINGETLRSVLTGFTITGGSGSLSRGFFWYDTTMKEYSGGGIKVWNESGGRIEYNRIINNVINRPTENVDCAWGAGIEIMGVCNICPADSIIILNNTISNNTTNAWFGGPAGFDVLAEYILFENNIVEENSSNSNGSFGFATIDVWWTGDITIAGNLIKGNTSFTADGRFGGGGIYCQGCSPKIYNNIIMENSTNGWGGGVGLDEHNYNILKAIVINNVIINNTAEKGGAIWIQSPGLGDDIPIFFNNIVWGNTATTNPGMSINGPIHLYNSLVQDSAFSNINNGIFCVDPLIADTQCRLDELSPCLGRGVASLDLNGTLYQAPAFDFDGNSRPSGIDPLIDLGAYESDYAALAFPVSFNLSNNFIYPTTGTIHFTSEILNYHHQDINVFSKIYNSAGSSQDSVELFDDGQHADGLNGDGSFAASYQTSTEDIFTNAIAIQNNDKNIRHEYPHNQKFTTIGPLVYEGYTIVTTGDSHIDPGEIHRLKLQIQNSGQTATASKITAKITPLDTFVTIISNNFQFNDIPAGQTVLSTNYRTVRFSKYFSGPIDTVRFAIDISSDGYIFWRDSTFMVVVNVENESPVVPISYSLKQNYPNPFNPNTSIEFSLPKTEYVTLKVYNVLGQQVKTLVSEKLNQGVHKYEWQANNLPSGIYYCRLQAGEYEQVRKMILLR
jgi:hypothetical protein